MRFVLLAVIGLGLAGCGISQAAKNLRDSRAKLDATYAAEVQSGRMTPEQAMEMEDAADEMESQIYRENAVPSHSYEPPAPYIQPTYEAPASVIPAYTTPMQTVPLYTPAPPPPPTPRFVPYGAVAPFMPGIAPDGTAR